MKYALLGLIFASLLIANRAMATEQPSYTASQQSGPIEVRQYGAMVAAEVSVAGDRETASSAGFRALAGYIFGGNSGKKSIAMTAPVTIEPQLGSAQQWRIHFVMPSQYTLATLPQPNNPAVRLRKVLDIPRQALPIMLLAVGRQGEKGVYNPRLRFPLDQQVTWL